MKIRMFIELLIMAGVFLLSLPASSEFYQYEDEKGTIHFTDDSSKIPKKFKKKRKVREDSMSDPNSSVTRVFISGNQVRVPVTVAYRGKEVKATFILDTGATTCTISPGLADRLNIRPEDADASLAQGIGGAVFVVGHTKLDYISVGPNRKYDMDISVVKSGQSDGLLGMNFLRELRYHIDFDTSTIKWGN
jgi:clan AA aspartic protease (TIGR02281 family)